MPLTEAALAHIADPGGPGADFLGQPLIVEESSTYLEFRASQMPEAGSSRLCKRPPAAGCCST